MSWSNMELVSVCHLLMTGVMVSDILQCQVQAGPLMRRLRAAAVGGLF